jgi:hypothetical protein
MSTRNPDEQTEPGRALGGRGTVRGRGLGRWVQARLGEPGWLEGVAGAYGVGDAGVGEAGGQGVGGAPAGAVGGDYGGGG